MRDPDDIYNWRRLSDRITTSGQPTEAQLEAIRDLGVSHVVNLGLHTHERALPDEKGAVTALGMTYIHLPVDFTNPTKADIQAFNEAMSCLEGHKVHVHCIANYRVSAFFYRRRVDVMGWTPEAARADLEAIWTPQGPWAALVDPPREP